LSASDEASEIFTKQENNEALLVPMIKVGSEQTSSSEMAKPILVFDYDETLVDSGNHLHQGIPELLSSLFAQKYTLWIVSFNERLFQRIAKHQIVQYFSQTANGFHFGGKVAMLNRLCEQNKVSLADCILFDDMQRHVDEVREAGGNAYLVPFQTGVTQEIVDQALSQHNKNADSNTKIATKQEKEEEAVEEDRNIFVGTENAVKLRAVREIFPDYKVVGCKGVQSGVSSQPIGLEETIQGAKNRALACMKQQPNACVWIGLENGLIEYQPSTFHDVPVCVLIWAHTPTYPVITIGPRVITSCNGRANLQSYQNEIAQVDNRVVEYFTAGHVTRLELLRSVVKIARYTTNP